ncbi:MAG TPA: putative porin [Pseudomonadales bacterium]|nr:putative porin [Pseudomonadales bacterium]
MAVVSAAARVWGQDSTNAPAAAKGQDALLDLLIQKGILTQQEAGKVQAEAAAMNTNIPAQMPSSTSTKWIVSPAIKSMELYGDMRVRYESRTAEDPGGDSINLQRFRYSLRVGLRGDMFDNFFYGFRLETGSSPRSPWVTFGTSTSSSTAYYYGPYGKSTAGLNVGQLYIGWRPADWMSVTVGKMPNPLFTSTMVWSANIEPEGAAEQFKYTVGQADFFANFVQFLYADENTAPTTSFIGLPDTSKGVFQIAWEAGLDYHITPKLSAKVASTIYSYYGLSRSTATSGTATSPYYGDPYIGEGAYGGPNSQSTATPGYITSVYGYSGFGNGSTLPGYESVNYPNNQVGLNDLLVLEIPFQVNYKFKGMDAHLFGDYAYNLDGAQRAEAAAQGYAAYLATLQPPVIQGFSAQTRDVHAYQVGVGIGSDDVEYGPSQGLVYGTGSPKHAWEVRTYWQHIEQYSLDPNLLDLDFFNGLENLQGIYVAASYAFTGNVIGTFRYGHASRINDQLGTGGSSGDIPQINPVNNYDIYQADLTVRF